MILVFPLREDLSDELLHTTVAHHARDSNARSYNCKSNAPPLSYSTIPAECESHFLCIVGALHDYFGVWEPAYYFVSVATTCAGLLTGLYTLGTYIHNRRAGSKSVGETTAQYSSQQ